MGVTNEGKERRRRKEGEREVTKRRRNDGIAAIEVLLHTAGLHLYYCWVCVSGRYSRGID